tara:strand:- start:1168 stop:1353 length:186 start_codon:yes stop_codon:yes gene_type:complete
VEEHDHLNSDGLLKALLKTLARNVELRGEISKNIKETKGGEKLSWIKKFNSLFINKWGKKK